ncbi:MAG: acyl-CoA dehydrogenase, partial [Hellea sp.]|nr:acyl-CoA dehydrogenase [Hellea sp.]
MTSDNKLRHNWEDPLFFDRCLSEDEVIVRNMARNYCTEKLMPRVKSAYSEERFD